MKKSLFLLLSFTGTLYALAQTDKEPYMTKSLSSETIKTVEANLSKEFMFFIVAIAKFDIKHTSVGISILCRESTRHEVRRIEIVIGEHAQQ